MANAKIKTRMYSIKGKKIPQWNPRVGCNHGCVYCPPSFQRQTKRQGKRCKLCYYYKPHFHPERLSKLPSGDVIAACLSGDVAFAHDSEIEQILAEIRRRDNKTFLIQSKDPRIFLRWQRIFDLSDNLLLGTTIETNKVIFTDLYTKIKHKNKNRIPRYLTYSEISRAPYPIIRYTAMTELNHRKFVTIEPILDFNLDVMVWWIKDIKPEVVWIGYDNHKCWLPEPELLKTKALIAKLEQITEVIPKSVDRPAWWEVGGYERCVDMHLEGKEEKGKS